MKRGKAKDVWKGEKERKEDGGKKGEERRGRRREGRGREADEVGKGEGGWEGEENEGRWRRGRKTEGRQGREQEGEPSFVSCLFTIVSYYMVGYQKIHYQRSLSLLSF